MATIAIQRSAATVLSPLIDDSSKRYKTLNGADYIVLSFKHDEFVEFFPGDYITWAGVTYSIQQVPKFDKKSEIHYVYELRFEGPYYALDLAQLFLDEESEFTLTGTAEDFINLIVVNLNRVHGAGAYSTGTISTTDFKTLSFKNESCLNVLQRICNEFELEYYFSGDIVINLSTSIGVATGLSYQYAAGLRNITRNKFSSKDLITRLFAYGADKNIVNTYDTKRLHLPAGTYPDRYAEQNTTTYGIREATKFWEDIYPRFTGTVDSSSANNVIIDAGIDFDLNNYLIEGVTAKIVFKTGDLAGMEFEISEYNHSTHQVTFNEYTDESGGVYPSATFNPSAGDEFTFVDIEMPAAYITAAEADLETAALAFLNDMSSPNVQYEVEVDWHYLQSSSTSLDVGDLVEITDTQLAPGGINYRILQLEQGIANPYKYSIKTGEHVLVSYMTRMNTSIQDVTRMVTAVRRETVQDIRRGYLATDELRGDIFDNDGYFDTTNIRPLSIETSMLTVGNKSTQLTLSSVLAEPNYQGNENYLEISAGQLIHFTLEATAKTWDITSYSSTTLSSGSSYYMYVRCQKVGSSAIWIVSTTQYQVDPDDGYYYFLVGHLSSPFTGVRRISWLYGQTTINGGFIRTGRISSIGGGTYFDLESGVIAGVITFASGSSGYANLSDRPTSLGDINSTDASNLASALSTANSAQADATQALADAAAAQSTADGAIICYYQATAPVGASEGDIWFDTDDGNKIYVYESDSWVNRQDSDIAAAINSAQTAQTTADGKAIVFFQTTAPVSGMSEGDIWIDTNDSYKQYVYSGSAWVETTTADALQALSDAAAAQSTADGKIVAYYQNSQPGTGSLGDIWFDTDDGNKIYVHNGTSWIESQDNDIALAINNAQTAQTTADGKAEVFYQASAPTGASAGDLWVETDNGNRTYIYSGSSWIATSVLDAINALANAATAQSTADSKIAAFYQPVNPISGMDIGDIWFDTSDGNRIHTYRAAIWLDNSNQVFRQTTAPTSGMVQGDWWIDTDGGNAVDTYSVSWVATGGTVYAQDTEPTSGMTTGDLWVDTDGGNAVYEYSGSAWVAYTGNVVVQNFQPTDGTHEDLWIDSGDSFTAYQASGGWVNYIFTRYIQSSAPSSGMSAGDVWFDSDDSYAPYIYHVAEWVDNQDGALAQVIQDVSTAQASADGKVTTFFAPSTEPPTAEGVGDLWFQTNTGKLIRWNGSSWGDDVADVTQTIIDGGLITTGRLEVKNSTTTQGGIQGTTAAGSTEIGLWLGATYANRASAPFRVTHGGAVTMTMATVQSASSGQRVVIDSTNNRLSFYDATKERLRIDTSIYSSQPGIRLYGDTNDATYVTPGQIRIQSADEVTTTPLYISQAYAGTGNIYGGYISNQSAYSATTGSVYGLLLTVEGHSSYATAVYALYATASTGPSGATWAGYFDGNVHITGNLTVDGTSPGGGSSLWTLTGGYLTYADSVKIGAGSGALRLMAGPTADHVYMEFFADSAAQTTRSGYLGYPSAGTTHLYLKNEFASGNLYLDAGTSGTIWQRGGSVNRYYSNDTNHVWYISGTAQLALTSSEFRPYTTGGLNLGGTSNRWGTAYTGQVNIDHGSVPMVFHETGTNNYVRLVYDAGPVRWDFCTDGDGQFTPYNVAMYMYPAGAVALNYNGSVKILTTSGGVSITGGAAFTGTLSGTSWSMTDAGALSAASVNITSLTVSTLSEKTSGVGVTIDSALIKDGRFYGTDTSSHYRVESTGHEWYVSITKRLQLTSSALLPGSSGGTALGTSLIRWGTVYATLTSVAQLNKVVYDTSTGQFTYEADSSDVNLKRNIKRIKDARDKLMLMNGYTFRFTQKARKITGQDPRILRSGLIAQEVQKVFPAPVREIGGTGYLSIEYKDMTGLIVEGIKENYQEVKALQEEILQLKNQINQLTN